MNLPISGCFNHKRSLWHVRICGETSIDRMHTWKYRSHILAREPLYVRQNQRPDWWGIPYCSCSTCLKQLLQYRTLRAAGTTVFGCAGHKRTRQMPQAQLLLKSEIIDRSPFIQSYPFQDSRLIVDWIELAWSRKPPNPDRCGCGIAPNIIPVALTPSTFRALSNLIIASELLLLLEMIQCNVLDRTYHCELFHSSQNAQTSKLWSAFSP